MKKAALFLFSMFFVGLFGTLAAEANSGPINYSTLDSMLVTPRVCQIYNDTLDLVLTSYATDQPTTGITTVLDKGILDNIADKEQYLGRTMVSMQLGEMFSAIRNQAATQGPTMANKLSIAKQILQEAFISCRQDVGKNRDAWHRN